MDSDVNPKRLGEFLSKNARHRLTLLVLEKMNVEQVKTGLKADPRGRPRGKESVLADMMGVKQRTVHRWLDPYGVQANDSNATELAYYAFGYDKNRAIQIVFMDIAEYKKTMYAWIKDLEKIDGSSY
jgi:hypothetical protein